MALFRAVYKIMIKASDSALHKLHKIECYIFSELVSVECQGSTTYKVNLIASLNIYCIDTKNRYVKCSGK